VPPHPPLRAISTSLRRPPRRVVAIPLAVLALAGCTTIDPSADLARTEAMVADRLGSAPGWDEAVPAWDGVSPLTADLAAAAALRGEPGLRAEVATIAAAHAERIRAGLLPNPVLTVSVGLPIDGGGGEPIMIGIVQQIAALWSRPARVDAAEADLRSRMLAVANRALGVDARARTAHAEAIAADRLVAIERDGVEVARRALDLVERRVAGGTATGLDEDRARLAVHRLEAALADRRAEAATARRRLLEAIGRAGESAGAGMLALADGKKEAPDADLDEEAAVRLALLRRLDVAAAVAAAGAADARVRLAAAERWSSVSVGAGFQENFMQRQAVGPQAAITLPLLDDGRAAEARASANAESAAWRAEAATQQAIGEVRRAMAAWLGARERASIERERLLPTAERAARRARAAYEAGATNLTVLLEAETEVVGARRGVELADLAVVRHRIELERACGGRLDDASIEAWAARTDDDARTEGAIP